MLPAFVAGFVCGAVVGLFLWSLLAAGSDRR